MPMAAQHVWWWFLELNAARGNNGFGPSPITYSDIMNWKVLTAIEIAPWEVKAIKLIDVQYLEIMGAPK